jgi:hypothetical protein
MQRLLRLFARGPEPPSLSSGLTLKQLHQLYGAGAAPPIREAAQSRILVFVALWWPIRLGPSIGQTGTESRTPIVDSAARFVLVRFCIRNYFYDGSRKWLVARYGDLPVHASTEGESWQVLQSQMLSRGAADSPGVETHQLLWTNRISVW